MNDAATTAWIVGLCLVGLTIALHAFGLVYVAVSLNWLRIHVLRRAASQRLMIWFSVMAIGMAGAALAILHAVEAAIWAFAYLWLGALRTVPEAVLYSVDSMTTRGASGMTLAHHWVLLGALEAANGILLFGMSTAFLFGALQRIWALLASDEHLFIAGRRSAQRQPYAPARRTSGSLRAGQVRIRPG